MIIYSGIARFPCDRTVFLFTQTCICWTGIGNCELVVLYRAYSHWWCRHWWQRWTSINWAGPDYFKQVVRPVSEVSWRSLRSASRGDLFVSRANTSIGQRSFSIAAPVVWNALPPDLRHGPLNAYAHRTSVANSSDPSWKLICSDKHTTLHDSSENNLLKSETL